MHKCMNSQIDRKNRPMKRLIDRHTKGQTDKDMERQTAMYISIDGWQ